MPSLYPQIPGRHTMKRLLPAPLCLCLMLLLAGCHSSYTVNSDGNPEIPKGGIVPPPISAEQQANTDKVIAALSGKSFAEQQQYIKANRRAYITATRSSKDAMMKVLVNPDGSPIAAP